MADLCLMRHGRVEMWHIKRFLGKTDVALDEHGRAQADWWGQRLGPGHFDAIWCSDLQRSRETAERIARGNEITVVPAIAEIDLGDWDGLPMAELKETDPDAFEARGRDLAHFRPPGGESFADLASRVIPPLNDILVRAAESERDHLVVAHLGVNRVYLAHALGMDLDHIMRIEQGYTCINRIRLHKSEPRLASMNITPELLGWSG